MNALPAVQWLDLFLHFAALSLLAIGGAITTAPDMQRYLVERGWIDNEQFTSSIALKPHRLDICLWPCWAGTSG